MHTLLKPLGFKKKGNHFHRQTEHGVGQLNAKKPMERQKPLGLYLQHRLDLTAAAKGSALS
ncbi:DUF4304 domain-containing protein [Neisseria elongata]|uniref:DUF4304 domain-containing protein n=1 Tax=Neisseria elongata TaxID=495 RepID=UPI0024B0CEC7|nr:DUF4304 domain-containing protein [Neisseria elongata]